MAIGKIVGGLTNIVGASIGGRARRREEKAAQGEFNSMKQRYAELDTSNPYQDMSNPYEDLTVNTQAADFATQQSQQGAANVMSGLAAAAGGSGIAALAQSLSNSQNQQAQAASASIAQQEQRNQTMAAQGEQQRQQMVAGGEMQSRQMEAAKTSNMLSMAGERLGAAKEARASAKQALMGGITDTITGGVEMVAGGGFGSGGGLEKGANKLNP